ncbi:hypothetical protein MMYC01_207913 [Madurella mycetomatis]|uniref:Berberine/berberine-like domain-containing protein n=1 Tax=Madurella mycetomatis TaxID=100816 RepID=A0A175VT65_9PEZI|nr:hypothetical protein MMYC01_207913 [Madurella mycetomatis]
MITHLTAYNKAALEVEATMKPFLDTLNSMGVKYDTDRSHSGIYYDHHDNYFDPLPHRRYLGRHCPIQWPPRPSLSMEEEQHGHRRPLVHAAFAAELSFDPRHRGKMIDNQRLMTYNIVPVIEKMIPGSGAYMNEVDFQQPRWQTQFFGSNYDGLECIKRKYDPETTSFMV